MNPQESMTEQSGCLSGDRGRPLPEPDADSKPEFGEQLLGQVQPSQAAGAMVINNMPPPTSVSPHDQNIDPAIAGPVMAMPAQGEAAASAEDPQTPTNSRAGGNRRELSSTKRAAQNRAAQVCLDLIFPLRSMDFYPPLDGFSLLWGVVG